MRSHSTRCIIVRCLPAIEARLAAGQRRVISFMPDVRTLYVQEEDLRARRSAAALLLQHQHARRVGRGHAPAGRLLTPPAGHFLEVGVLPGSTPTSRKCPLACRYQRRPLGAFVRGAARAVKASPR